MRTLRTVARATDATVWPRRRLSSPPVRLRATAPPATRALSVLALALWLACTCTRPLLPPRLAGLHRTRVWTGERAARLIAELHGKQVAPRSSLVADYGARGELRVYVSLYQDDAEAFGVLGTMIGGMRSGRTPFSPPQQETAGSGRWLTFGPGGHNELWVSQGRLYWLQGLPDAVQQAAAELPPPVAGNWT